VVVGGEGGGEWNNGFFFWFFFLEIGNDNSKSGEGGRVSAGERVLERGWTD
jgi:hypothetical protein